MAERRLEGQPQRVSFETALRASSGRTDVVLNLVSRADTSGTADLQFTG